MACFSSCVSYQAPSYQDDRDVIELEYQLSPLQVRRRVEFADDGDIIVDDIMSNLIRLRQVVDSTYDWICSALVIVSESRISFCIMDDNTVDLGDIMK